MMFAAAAAGLIIPMLMALARGLIGPTLYDRVLAGNSFGTKTVLLIAVLGFIGLPTLGYHLESLLRQGFYAEAAPFFYALLILIATQHRWCRGWMIPALLLAALWWLPPIAPVNASLIWQFLTYDIVPVPLRSGVDAWPWLVDLWQSQLWPGLVNTLVLAILSLVVMVLESLLVPN